MAYSWISDFGTGITDSRCAHPFMGA